MERNRRMGNNKSSMKRSFPNRSSLLRHRLVLAALVFVAALVSLTTAQVASTGGGSSNDEDEDDHVATVATTITDPITLKVMPQKTVLVTGGAGFVGSHVADYLLGRGDAVVIVDEVNDYYDVRIKEGNLQMLQTKYNSTQRLFIYRGDIVDDDFLQTVFHQHPMIDAVCHMAARAGVRPSIVNPFIYLHSNIVGTVKLMEQAVKHRIGNFVFASSSSVYGGSPSVYFSELERVDRPISPYAATKKACELFAYVYQHLYGLNITALRFFTVYGPRGRPDMAPFMFVDRVSRGQTIQQFGDGTSSRDYTYIDDIVQGVVRSVDTPAPYQILNLGKGSGTVLNEFMSMVEKYVGKKAVIDVLPDQPGDVPYTCANITLAHNHLGYEAKVPFADGIKRTVQWYKQAYPQTATTTSKRRRLAATVSPPHSKRPHAMIDWVKLMRRLQRQDSTIFSGGDLESDDMEAALVPSQTDEPHHDLRRRQLRRQLQSEGGESSLSSVLVPHTGHKKVLVTGGGGFLGSHVAEFLLSRGDSVVLVEDKQRESAADANLAYLLEAYGDSGRLTIFRGDVSDDADLTDRIFDERPEWICHLAAPSTTTTTSDLGMDPTATLDLIHDTIKSTVRLLELSKDKSVASNDSDETGYTIRNFVLASSSAVYGRQTLKTDVDTSVYIRHEDDRVDYPKTPSGASAKTAELLAYTYHHLYQIPVSVVRLFEMYGPRYDVNSLPFRIVDRMFATGSAALTADVTSHDFVYIDDVVRGIVSALDRPNGYEIYNLGGGREACVQGTGLAEFEEAAQRRIQQPASYDEPNANHYGVDGGVSCANIDKAFELLAYKPTTLLEEGMQKTATWHQATYHPTTANISPMDVPLSSSQDTPKLMLSSAALVIESAADDETSSSSASISTFSSSAVHAPAWNTTFVKTKREETYFTNFPSWLRSLAVIQWFLVVTILFARAYCKSSHGPCHNSRTTSHQHMISSNSDETTSL